MEQKGPSRGVRNASVVEGTMWKGSVISLQFCKRFLLEVKIKYMKGKVHPPTGHEGQEREQWYRYTLSLTSILDGRGWLTPRPGRFTSGKGTRFQLHRRLGGPQERSGRMRKISLPRGFDPGPFSPQRVVILTTLTRPTKILYIYICVCVCVCVLYKLKNFAFQSIGTKVMVD